MVLGTEWPHVQEERSLQPEEGAEERISQPKTLSIKGRNSFFNLYKYGIKRSNQYMTVAFYRQNSFITEIRVSFVVSKKYGNAVKRNLCKRRLREITREVANQLIPGDYLIIMKPNAAKLDYKDLRTAAQNAVLKIQKTSST